MKGMIHMSIVELFNMVGPNVRLCMDETTFGNTLSLVTLLFLMYVYFTLDGRKSKETRLSRFFFL